ncbi:hypothetical protein V1283_007944 [Bradyrhizobium sp. AZCC 2262]
MQTSGSSCREIVKVRLMSASAPHPQLSSSAQADDPVFQRQQ